jgi:hypothetical protein
MGDSFRVFIKFIWPLSVKTRSFSCAIKLNLILGQIITNIIATRVVLDIYLTEVIGNIGVNIYFGLRFTFSNFSGCR